MNNFLEEIQQRVTARRVQISLHAEREREDEHIEIAEITESILNGELLEDYPEDPRGHSCLILGFTSGGRAIHTVWTIIPDNRARLITVYLPKRPKWLDARTRARRQS